MLTKTQKNETLKEAIKLTKEFARCSHQGNPAAILRTVYEQLIEIREEINQSAD